MSGLCFKSGCGEPNYCKGYCKRHYDRLRRTGSPDDSDYTKTVAANRALRRQGRQICCKCKQDKHFEAFANSKTTSCGKHTECRECVADNKRVLNYGLTRQEFDALVIKQGSKCAICLTTFSTTFDTHVDHCHTTGRVRGLLCNGCNTGLGQFRDNPLFLSSAIDYLKGSNQWN